MTEIVRYYSQEDNGVELAEIIRSVQKRYAHVQASLIRGNYKTLQQQFELDGKHLTLTTQVAIRSIYGQIDSAIKGEAGEALKRQWR
ncbi:hypothetical protein MU448_01960 [Streptococcus sp. O1]|uniref:hypothetical protein n=1 Tax=Streptococcus sp. O1 TaxID=2928735 RepID=UPI00211AD745|nr:hypothetical protein [Streptococcus sp. O1]MCQ9213218.1 hypothetical protein [Streptococcus sp. O1]